MLRVLLAGRQVVHEPAAIVRHAHPREFAQFERRVWGYGVGLTACLTKAMRSAPSPAARSDAQAPRGLAFALSPSSEKNVEQAGATTRSPLTRLELRGMAYGPLAYARSRRQQRRRDAAGGPGTAAPGGAPPACGR